MSWYKKILLKNRNEIIASTVFAVIFALAVSLRHYFMGKSFEWQSISLVEAPGLLPRLFYSALVYITLGAFLYRVGFYKFLYSLYRGTRGGWRAYNEMKGVIWWSLVLGMYFLIIPLIVKILNAIISFCYNIFNLIMYLLPPLGTTLILFSVGYLGLKKYTGKNWLRNRELVKR